MMLENIYVLKVKLELLSGLYIGGNDSGFDIGGADTNVIKNPLTKEPYIPGSSFKGKLKALLKYRHGVINNTGKDLIFIDDAITNIFEGTDKKEGINITRAIFRDLKLTDESKNMLNNILGNGIYTEIKAENRINSIKGIAESPRFIERVPAGAIFEGEIVLNIFENDNKDKMMNAIKESLRLLEQNYLGGSGTRGYGRVKVIFNDFEEVEI